MDFRQKEGDIFVRAAADHPIPKLGKASVAYRIAPTREANCHLCRFVLLHGQQMATCQKVAGTVDAAHICDLFEARR